MSEQSSNLAAFLRNLVNAGVSIEEAAKQGFVFALEEAKRDENGLARLETHAMQLAAQKLEQAAREVGIHLDQQRARYERRREVKG